MSKGDVRRLISCILFVLIGIKLNMGTSYYVLLGIGTFMTMVNMIIGAYKKGAKNND